MGCRPGLDPLKNSTQAFAGCEVVRPGTKEQSAVKESQSNGSAAEHILYL
jgi:hypothetical protein